MTVIENIRLPWWGWLYLCFVLFVFLGGFFMKSEAGEEGSFDMNEFVASTFSLMSICVFVIAFFNVSVAHAIGIMVVPMTLLGVYWEFNRAVSETAHAVQDLETENDLDEGERRVLLNVAIAFNALVIVPGYMIGLILSLNILGLV